MESRVQSTTYSVITIKLSKLHLKTPSSVPYRYLVEHLIENEEYTWRNHLKADSLEALQAKLAGNRSQTDVLYLMCKVEMERMANHVRLRRIISFYQHDKEYQINVDVSKTYYFLQDELQKLSEPVLLNDKKGRLFSSLKEAEAYFYSEGHALTEGKGRFIFAIEARAQDRTLLERLPKQGAVMKINFATLHCTHFTYIVLTLNGKDELFRPLKTLPQEANPLKQTTVLPFFNQAQQTTPELLDHVDQAMSELKNEGEKPGF